MLVAVDSALAGSGDTVGVGSPEAGVSVTTTVAVDSALAGSGEAVTVASLEVEVAVGSVNVAESVAATVDCIGTAVKVSVAFEGESVNVESGGKTGSSVVIGEALGSAVLAGVAFVAHPRRSMRRMIIARITVTINLNRS